MKQTLMKTKQGFTFIEIVVSVTLLLLLSSIATTTMYNFLQATIKLNTQYKNIQNIMALHSALVNAKMNYATDLAFLIAEGTAPQSPPQQAQNAQNAQAAIQRWNISAQQNDSWGLINQLINPDQTLPIPIPPPLNPPPSRSYLPASRNVQVTNSDSNGNAVTTTVVVQINDIRDLLQAFELTDNGKPSGNPVATISVGPMLEVSSDTSVTSYTRPMLPIIDWKSGTTQEIQF